ncbi:hypothetical protein EDD36DRAFT_415587 [Exophiala viscosa]|uniref:DNA-directed RNA polymerase III subunit RPC9 n=1 Tax=Exophiala viscosa TaxID=2486360 RepID=A0AAN6IGH9_9EURO|nr:hypothetical protein EDD36DRAFT_415587 [Exophiala viscosa]
MKVLDPQSAILTNSEVHRFLASNPPRETAKKVGSYQPVNLKNYQRVRDDLQHYVTTTVPYIETFPPPETFVKAVVPKLRSLGVTKTEALVLINLGVGLPRNQPTEKEAEINGDAEEPNEEGAEDAQEEPDDRQLLSLVIEEVDDRFSGEQGEDKIQKVIETMRSEFDKAKATTNGTNGSKAS